MIQQQTPTPQAPIPVQVLPSTPKRRNARFGASVSLALGGVIVGLPEIVPTLQQMFPAHVKQIGWACIMAGWLWNSVQRGVEARNDGVTTEVDKTPQIDVQKQQDTGEA